MKRIMKIAASILVVIMLLTLTSCDMLLDFIIGGEDARPNDNVNVALGWPDDVTTGNPANRNNYLIERDAYALSYNNSKHIPNWVSWHLVKEHMGDLDRLDSFSIDDSLPEGFERVAESQYRSTGFDKGHMCPSNDRSGDRSLLAETYVMTNIVPQNPKNNSGPWRLLEKEIQDDVEFRGQEAYVICGSYGEGGQAGRGIDTFSDHIGKSKITVPSHVWKVAIVFPKGDDDIARLNDMELLDYLANPGITGKDQMKVYAAWMPNSAKVKSDFEEHLVSVDFIEAKTGYDFFSLLDDRKEEEIESFNSQYDTAHGKY